MQKQRLHRLLSFLLLSLLLLSACRAEDRPDRPPADDPTTTVVAAELTTREAEQTTQPFSVQVLTDAARPVEPSSAASADARSDPNDIFDASGFVDLSDVIPDAILEIRYYSTYNFVGERIDGYEEPIALLTREAAQALAEVSDVFREKGYRLKIFDAYRPQTAVEHFARWAQDPDDTKMKAYFYPDTDKSILFSAGYITYHSGHSRGCTVDLTLFDMKTGKEIDMGGPFDYFGALSGPGYTDLTEEQYANRMLLRQVMTDHGFRPSKTEWWDFSYLNEPYPNTYFSFPVSRSSLAPRG